MEAFTQQVQETDPTLPALDTLNTSHLYETIDLHLAGSTAQVKFDAARAYLLGGFLPPCELVEAVDFGKIEALPPTTFNVWLLSAFKFTLIERQITIRDAFVSLAGLRRAMIKDRKTLSVVTVRVADGELLS